MKVKVHHFMQTCVECQKRPPKPHTTLFQIAIAPNWSKYIVDYVEHHRFLEKVRKVRGKAMELESKDYELITNHVNKRGNEKKL